MKKGSNNRSDLARERARELRRNMGVSESVMWRLLRDRGNEYKFRRQHPVGPYFLDFYCREASLPSSSMANSIRIRSRTTRAETLGSPPGGFS